MNPAITKCKKCGGKKEWMPHWSRPVWVCVSCRAAAHRAYGPAYYEANKDRISANASARHLANKAKAAARSRAWHEANRERHATTSRRGNLRRNFGLTLEQWDEMFESQHGVCKICNKESTDGRRLHVDHSENGDKIVVRGLLCNLCNRGIGHFHDNPALLRLAALYLEGLNGVVQTTQNTLGWGQ